MNDRSLIGTPESCLPFISKLVKAGINEVACLIDFVQDVDRVINALSYLKQLKDKSSTSRLETAVAVNGS